MKEIYTLRRMLSTELVGAARNWRRTAEQALVSLEISEACAGPLLWIGRLEGGVRQVTLAGLVGIEGPSLVRLLDQLVESGHVVRKDDPTDRRAKTVWLTRKGKALSLKIEDRLVELRAEVLGDFSGQELETALRVLRAFEAQAGKPALPVPSDTL